MKQSELFDLEQYVSGTLAAINSVSNCKKDFDGAVEVVIQTLNGGGKVFFAGNGGSASDAQHLAAEFVGRFAQNRHALPAICLNTDTSVITALANDYGYETIFSRQLEALGNSGDVIILISTSGESKNLIHASLTAKNLGVRTIAFVGSANSRLAESAEVVLAIGEHETCHIQEAHITIGQALCSAIERWAISNR